jgi:hypothetical protein
VSESVIRPTLPGHNLPHVCVYQLGQKLPIGDLIPLNKLLLLVDDQPDWSLLKTTSIDIEQITESNAGNSCSEPTGGWQKLLDGNQAVLLGPDGIIAWRGSWHSSLPQLWPAIVDEALYMSTST